MKQRMELLDKMIKGYGFENKWVIWFAELTENKEITLEELQTSYWIARNFMKIDQEMAEKF